MSRSVIVFGILVAGVIALSDACWNSKIIGVDSGAWQSGPMRVGPHGLLQPIADGLKLMLKEDIIPAKADRIVFMLAPVITLIPAFIVFAVIPFGSSSAFHIPTFQVPFTGFTFMSRTIGFTITDINIGVLYVLSISSVSIIGIIPRAGGLPTANILCLARCGPQRRW